MNATYTISASQRNAFNELLAKSNRKSTKLGMPGLTATFGEIRKVEVVGRNGRPTGNFTSMVDVTISGVNPVLNGWRLIAVVSPLKADDGKLMAVTTMVPGETFGELVADPLNCDHCKVRRDRLETFIVRHESGETKQVARNCLKDYVGGNNCDADSVAALIGLRNKLAAATEALGNVRDFTSVSFRNVMAFSIAAIRQHGWLSKGAAYVKGGTPTAAWVNAAMEFANTVWATPEVRAAALIERGLNEASFPTEADFEAATSKLEDLSVVLDRMESEGSTNDYTQALRILTVAGTVNRKAMGIAVSAISFIARELAPKAAVMVSNYIGSVGEKITVKANLVSANKLGTGSTLLTFTTADGNVVKYFANGPVSVTEGSTYEVAGKVKAHQEFRGRKETMLNYAKVNP
jgi:hypothetical protein